MKTKITILLTALLMLVGISVNAQVKNQTPKRAETTTPIKGDVNEDGVVDVADINAIIEIMKNGGGTSGETKYYWYVGADQPTAVNQPTAWRTSTTDAGFSVTVELNAGTTWFAIPNTWTYSAIDKNNMPFEFNAFVAANIKNSISGYTIKKIVLSSETTITITFSKKETAYYWYVGQTPPESISTEPQTVTGAVEGWHEIGTSIGTYSFESPLYDSILNPIHGSSNSNWYVALPHDSSLALYDSDDVNDITTGNWIGNGNVTINNVQYDVYKWNGSGRNFSAWLIH